MELEVIRPKQFRDKFRDYHLIVDGEKVANIKPSSSTSVSIPETATYIQVKIDWCTSEKFPVNNIIANQITVKNGVTGSGWSILYTILFRPSQYLVIESGFTTSKGKSVVEEVLDSVGG